MHLFTLSKQGQFLDIAGTGMEWFGVLVASCSGDLCCDLLVKVDMVWVLAVELWRGNGME